MPLTSKPFTMQQDSYQHESTSSPSYASNLPPVQPMGNLFPNQPIPPIHYNQPRVIASTVMLTAWSMILLSLVKHINDTVTVFSCRLNVVLFSD